MVAATTDYWVNDQHGEPLFVVTAKANMSTSKMLPELIAEVRKLIGDRRITVVFDRGGYSPKLFVKILDAGFDILTYRKGRWRKTARRHFQRQHAIKGRLPQIPVGFSASDLDACPADCRRSHL
jgi:predicted metal-dependent phosphoesterase TrpH